MKRSVNIFLMFITPLSGTLLAGDVPVEIDASSCQTMLNGYDRMDERQREASANQVCSCALRYGRARIDNGLGTSSQQIKTNSLRLKRIALQQLNDKVETERSLNWAKYQEKLAVHETKFRTEKAELKAKYSGRSIAGYSQELHALNSRRSAEYQQLVDEQKAEEQDLRKRANESKAIVEKTINQMKSEATTAVTAQHKEFLNRIDLNSNALCRSISENKSIAEIEEELKSGIPTNKRTKGYMTESPIGSIDQIKGNEATITRTDGNTVNGEIGTWLYQGDIVETGGESAVNIAFIDETSFEVSENARLAMDEYIYDHETESGTAKFSILRGIFVFTSGLIGRDDPDDVTIDTPVGSLGFRG